MAVRWVGHWGLGGKGEGIGKYRLVVTKQSRDVKFSPGSIVSNTAISMYGAGWVLDLLRDHFVNYMNVYSLCYTPETNINKY